MQPELRPLSAGQVIDTALRIVRRHWLTFLAIVLYVVAPLELVNALIAGTAFDADGTADTDTALVLGAGALSLVISLFATTLASGAAFQAVTETYLGRVPSWSRSLGYAVRRAHALLWVTVIATLVVLAPMIALVAAAAATGSDGLAWAAVLTLIFPGIFLWVAFSVSTPALVGEDLRGTRALRRSYRLVAGRWWAAFGLWLLAYLLVFVVAGILGAIFGAALGSAIDTDTRGGAILVNALTSILVGTVATPFLSAVAVVLYVDLRVRKEGLGIELLARGLDSGSVARST
jgi:hypothetical protein